MSTILYTSTYGSNDPTRANHSFLAALGAAEAAHHVQTLCETLHETLQKRCLWYTMFKISKKVIGRLRERLGSGNALRFLALARLAPESIES